MNDYDLLFVPGGDAGLVEGKDEELLPWIREVSANAVKVMAVCTGTVLSGMMGVPDGRKATTNKVDFGSIVHLAPNVDRVKEARWVEDGKFFTSSGVSAGMDIGLAVIANLFGMEMADRSALGCKQEWHGDPSRGPFRKAGRYGLSSAVFRCHPVIQPLGARPCELTGATVPLDTCHFWTYLWDMSDPGPNPLIRLFLSGTAVGFAISALFVTAIWLMDIAGIATRASDSDDAFLLLFVLWFFNGLLFGAVQISYAVWQLGREDG